MDHDDAQLLKAYADSGDEAAFTELVGRYAGMVFGAAMRKTGDRQTSEEIAQNVFTILARKAARLNAEPVLSGWLFRTTQCQRVVPA